MALAGRDVGLAVVDGHLVGHKGLFLVDTQNGAVRDHTVQALVGAAGGGDDHLAIAFGEVAGAARTLGFHERIVVRKKRAPFGRAAGKPQ